jgi:hypothetical protein
MMVYRCLSDGVTVRTILAHPDNILSVGYRRIRWDVVIWWLRRLTGVLRFDTNYQSPYFGKPEKLLQISLPVHLHDHVLLLLYK